MHNVKEQSTQTYAEHDFGYVGTDFMTMVFSLTETPSELSLVSAQRCVVMCHWLRRQRGMLAHSAPYTYDSECCTVDTFVLRFKIASFGVVWVAMEGLLM